jgi:hypothetical protein
MFTENNVSALLNKYSRPQKDVIEMKKRISERQKQYKAQAKGRALSNETLMRCYNV